jgi:hypothetical protein
MQTNNKQRTIQWARYIIAMIITVAIFGSVLYISQVATNKRMAEVRSIQDKIAIDLLSSETQFSLLSSAGCTQDGNSILAPEIGQLGDRLTFMEGQLGMDNPEVIGLKKYYSLLQIKDYMLMKELGEKCNFKPVTLVYFYSNEDCSDCTKQGFVLTALREKYPLLRVYAFDADLDLSAIKTLQTITNAPGTVPSMVIGGKVYTGFKSIEEIEKAVPALAKMLADQKAAENKTPTKITQ